MNPQFIIVTNRGVLRAGWMHPVIAHRPPQLQWVEELAFVHPREHYIEQVTDSAGAFAATESTGSSLRHKQSSLSEVHWKIEADRRAVEDLAEAIRGVLEREKPEFWSLSVPPDIHNMLEEALPERARERLLRVIPLDLGRAPAESVIEHFKDALLRQWEARGKTHAG